MIFLKIIIIHQRILDDYKQIKSDIKELYNPIMIPIIQEFEHLLHPGFVDICWTSMNILSYYGTLHKELKSLRNLMKQVIHTMLCNGVT